MPQHSGQVATLIICEAPADTTAALALHYYATGPWFVRGAKRSIGPHSLRVMASRLACRARRSASSSGVGSTTAIRSGGVWPVNASILSTAIPVPITASRNLALPIVSSMRSAPSSATFASIAAVCSPALEPPPGVLRFPFHPLAFYQKRLQTTRLNIAGNRRTCYASSGYRT